ncbi:MAG: protein kinase [Pyrinomonadaceae bacterium MAG19_C2-C3]|nr:protein kinase [Pyrinomonadaceae bacterium MAG19_C2-C3]
MKPERWKQIGNLFDDALELEGEARASFLDARCGDDAELRAEVESLLTAHEQSQSFIETPALNVAARLLSRDDEDGVGTFAVGQDVGRYEIHSLIGRGGMGEVYLAEDSELERLVALKVLPTEIAKDTERVRRFVQEAKSASALNHPNILTIHEIGQFGDSPFIASEYIAGETLRDREGRSDTEPLTLDEVIDVAAQVAAALNAAHAADIVHRDIKPENIMLRGDGLVKVLDFGLAKLTERKQAAVDMEAATRFQVLTTPGMVIGTPGYMSPEQARGKATDARSDVWSLGVVIYEMLAGKPPFAGETPNDTLAAILKEEPEPLHENTPVELNRIIRKSLQKNRDERYQTVKDLLIDLKNLQRELEFTHERERLHLSTFASPNTVTTQGRDNFTTNAATVVTANQNAKQTTTTSSAEYVIGEIKRHKTLTLATLLVTVLAALGLVIYLSVRTTATAIDSIAVMPFVNFNQDPETEYLSDGVTESIINNLTQLPQLRVIPRNSVFRYKGKEIDTATIANALGVRAVLTGRITRRGDALTISAELVDVSNDKQLWGEQYVRKVSDALAMQRDISREISEHLRLKLSGADVRHITTSGTDNPAAYQSYLKGRFYWNRRTTENLQKAIEEFQAAANIDPDYALAYVGIADCYALLEEYAGTPSRETLPPAKAAAERALQLDNTLAEAHVSLAFILTNLWQWEASEKEFKQSFALNPNYPTAHQWYSGLLRDVGRLEESLVEDKRAQQLDPLSLVINANLGLGYLLDGDVYSAIEQSRKVIELNPNYAPAHSILGLAYLQRGSHAEALAELSKAVEVSNRASGILCFLGYGEAVTGNRAAALKIIKELEAAYATRQARGQDIAQIYAALGDKDQAFAWLEKDYQVRSGGLPVIRWYPMFAPLRDDARYADLLRRMNL